MSLLIWNVIIQICICSFKYSDPGNMLSLFFFVPLVNCCLWWSCRSHHRGALQHSKYILGRLFCFLSSLPPSVYQGMLWGNSTPLPRKSSSTGALTSSSSAGGSWRPPTGWKLLNCTETWAGRPTQRDWDRAESKIISSKRVHYR